MEYHKINTIYERDPSTFKVTDKQGLVGSPVETLYDKRGSRVIVKLKTKDFAKG